MALLSSCERAVESPVPRWGIYYELAPQHAAYRELLTPGGMILVTESEVASMRLSPAGIAVVRSLTEDEYYAFDLTCTVETNPWSRLERSGLQLRCPRCGSRYDVLSGAGVPLEGPANSPLRRYRASRTSQGLILVTN